MIFPIALAFWGKTGVPREKPPGVKKNLNPLMALQRQDFQPQRRNASSEEKQQH